MSFSPEARRAIASMAALLLLMTACRGGSDSGDGAPSTATGNRFRSAGNGVVLDQRTGLQWTSRDHDRALAWGDADRHCHELTLGETTDWRLPDIEELHAVYDERFTEPCGNRSCHLDPAIRLGDPYVWSLSAPSDGARFYFDFGYGNRFSPSIPPTLVRRVLCVRRAR